MIVESRRHGDAPLRVVVDHSVVVVPEHVLRPRRSLLDDAGQGQLGTAVYVVLVPAPNEGHGRDDLEMHFPGDDAGLGGHLTFVETGVALLHVTDLQHPIVGAFFV